MSTLQAPVKTQTRVVVAATEERLRVLMGQILAHAGMDVHELASSHDVISETLHRQPQVVILDLGISVHDVLSCVRILHRNPQTAQVGIIVVCQKSWDQTVLREFITLGVSGLLVKPLKEQTLLQKVQEVARQVATKPRENHEHQVPGATYVKGNNSLLMRRVNCPFHKEQQPFDHFLLRTGKMGMEMSFFGVPLYTEPSKGSDYVDYHLLAVTTCPVCWFATSDVSYFGQHANRREDGFQFDAATIQAMNRGMEQRATLAQEMSDNWLTHQRTLDDAIKSYRVAIMTAQQLYACNAHGFQIELARAGNYHLRVGMLLEKSGAGREAVDAEYAAAMAIFQNAYVYLHGPAFYRNIQQLVATAIYFGEDAKAYQYLSRLKEVFTGLQGDERTLAERYLNDCQKAWEDRDFHRRSA